MSIKINCNLIVGRLFNVAQCFAFCENALISGFNLWWFCATWPQFIHFNLWKRMCKPYTRIGHTQCRPLNFLCLKPFFFSFNKSGSILWLYVLRARWNTESRLNHVQKSSLFATLRVSKESEFYIFNRKLRNTKYKNGEPEWFSGDLIEIHLTRSWFMGT